MGISDYMKWKISRQVGAQDKLIQLPQSKMVWDIMHLLKLVGMKRCCEMIEENNVFLY